MNKIIGLCYFLVVLLIAFLSFIFLENSRQFNGGFLEAFANWDGGYFLTIAQHGYTQTIHYAFFPLFPLLLKIGGIGVSWLSFLGIVLVLGKLLKEDYSDNQVNRIFFFFLLFPTAFFLLMIYSESLFLFLTLITFYLARKQKFGWATIAAILASLTRPFGVATIIGLLIEWKLSKNKSWWPLLSPIGLVGYCFYLWQTTGNPLVFLDAQNNWQRQLSVDGLFFFQYLPDLFKGCSFNTLLMWMNYLLLLLSVGILIRSYRKIRTSYFFYSVVVIVMPLVTGSLMSLSRLLLINFPLFIMLGIWLGKYQKWRMITYGIIGGILEIFLLSRFITGYWVG